MKHAITTREQALALSGSNWLSNSRGVMVVELEGSNGVADAIGVIDQRTGRQLAFIGPDFPAEHDLASLEQADADVFAAIFGQTLDEWFLPRVRGVIGGSVFAIKHGWKTPHDARAAMTKLLKARPSQQAMVLRDNRPMQRLLDGLPELPIDRRRRTLAMVRDAFPPERGAPGDANRRFFLEALTGIARDAGCPLVLPSRDNEEATTQFFDFIVRAREIVLDRVAEDLDRPPVRRRLAPFACSRIALLSALSGLRQVVQN